MKTSKHVPKSKPKPASIAKKSAETSKHARVLGKLGGRPKSEDKVRFTPSQR